MKGFAYCVEWLHVEGIYFRSDCCEGMHIYVSAGMCVKARV